MKKAKGLRILLMLAISVTVIAASAVLASAENLYDCKVNPNADYKYSKEYTVKTDRYNPSTSDSIKVKVEATENIFDPNNYMSVPDGFGKYLKIYWKITIPDGYKDYDVKQATDKTKFYGNSLQPPRVDWKQVGNILYGAAYTAWIGEHGLDIVLQEDDGTYTGSLCETIHIPFVVSPARPLAMKITSYPDLILFNAGNVSAESCGSYSYITRKDTGEMYQVKNTTGAYIEGLTPGKTYDFILAGVNIDSDGNKIGKSSMPYEVSVPMGPKTKPVIKSVKISNVKVKKYFDKERWKYRYKTTFKIKVTLSKKPAKIKGSVISISGISGMVGSVNKTVKGTGKTFTASVSMDTPKTIKNKSAKVTVRTYSNNTYKCYSDDAKTKTVKIK